MKTLACILALFASTSAYAYDWAYVPKNHISLMCGIGPNNFDIKKTNDQVLVQQKFSIIGGIAFDRRITKGVTFGVQAFSNNTLMLSFGFYP